MKKGSEYILYLNVAEMLKIYLGKKNVNLEK